jgi:rubredoxin
MMKRRFGTPQLGEARAPSSLSAPVPTRFRPRRCREETAHVPKTLRREWRRSVEAQMQKWKCMACPYIYDPELGDPEAGIPPGTPFEELPDDWLCPDCVLGKEFFAPLD